ncbi:polyphosphate kinase 2 family protein [Flindersiella endophytica]
MCQRISNRLRLPEGQVDIAGLKTNSTPGFKGDKKQGKAALPGLGSVLSNLQERLYAEGRSGGNRSLLLVLQGMDTAGKGGVLRHSVGLVDPQGVHIKAFKAPSAEELGHDFLWRIRRDLPPAGAIGIFDRSHYEDVLAVRVHDLVPRSVWSRRYSTINRFEKKLVDSGVTVIKCFLHVSYEEQRSRLQARLDNPDKHWKYNPKDVEERGYWADYQQAYEVVLEKCNTDYAPWFVVPSDRKWYRNWAVTKLLIEHLQDIDPTWPPGDFDVDAEKARLAAT